MVAIALDVMSAEKGSDICLQAAVRALKVQPSLKVWLVGAREVLEAFVKTVVESTVRKRLLLEYADQVIMPDDDPVSALRQKKSSSTHKTIELVRKGYAQAAVSCANTGALMAISRYFLKRLPGVDRLSLSARYPTYDFSKDILLADVGASMDLAPVHLLQMARLLSCYAKATFNTSSVRVGLISCGVEAGKGNALVKQTVPLLNQDSFYEFVGLLEPEDLFKRKADVALCDGFVGNAILKASESSARYVLNVTKQALSGNWFAKYCVGGLLHTFLKPYMVKIRPEKRDGAIVLGVNGVVVKSHGASVCDNVVSALSYAYDIVSRGAVDALGEVGDFSASLSLSEMPERVGETGDKKEEGALL